MATHTISTTQRPDELITVDEAEYERLLQLGLVYSGDPVAPALDFYDGVVADRVNEDGSLAQQAVDARVAAGGGGGGTVADATATTKGVVQLAGDLAGTAAAPTVPALADKADLVSGAVPDAQLPSRLSDAELGAAYEAHVDRTGAVAGTLPALQADGTLALQGLDELIDTTPITAADFGLAVPQGVRAYANATGQTITNAAYPVYLDLNTEEYNENAALFTIDFTGDKITVAEGGLFLVSWDADYSDTTGLREAYITKNGGNALAAAAAGSGGQTSRTFPLRLAANDYVQVICYVEGADVPLITNAPHRCGLALHRIGL